MVLPPTPHCLETQIRWKGDSLLYFLRVAVQSELAFLDKKKYHNICIIDSRLMVGPPGSPYANGVLVWFEGDHRR